MTNDETEIILDEMFNVEIVREILTEINPNITDEQISEIWNKCNGNPWNAGILYKLFELKHENEL